MKLPGDGTRETEPSFEPCFGLCGLTLWGTLADCEFEVNWTMEFQDAAKQLPTKDALNAAKGILIIAVVLGHARATSEFMPWLFAFLYLWHVQSFFILSVFRSKPLTWSHTKDIAARYLVPFFWITGLLSFGKIIFSGDIQQNLHGLALAWTFGSARFIEEAVGASIYWFLPTFFSLSILLGLVGRLSIGPQKVAIAIIIALGCAQGIFDWKIGTSRWPLGSGLVLYIAAQSYIFLNIWTIMSRSKLLWKIGMLIAAGIVLCAALTFVRSPSAVNISLFIWPSSPAFALGTYLLPVCVMLLILRICQTPAIMRVFKNIGQRSMWIYLFHQFILYAAWFIISRFIDEPPSRLESLCLAFSMVLPAIYSSIKIGEAIWKFPKLKAVLLPGTWKEFKSGLSFRLT